MIFIVSIIIIFIVFAIGYNLGYNQGQKDFPDTHLLPVSEKDLQTKRDESYRYLTRWQPLPRKNDTHQEYYPLLNYKYNDKPVILPRLPIWSRRKTRDLPPIPTSQTQEWKSKSRYYQDTNEVYQKGHIEGKQPPPTIPPPQAIRSRE